MLGLFKSGDELYADAMECINRRDYDKAKSQLQKAIDKNTSKKDMAIATICFLNMKDGLNNSSSYGYFSQSLEHIQGDTFTVGLTSFSKTQLINECRAMSACIEARGMSESDNQAMMKKGQAMIEAAKIMQMGVGQEMLKINEYFAKDVVSGQRIVTTLLAEANEILAESVVRTDTNKAAEYQQVAYNFRVQLGETGAKNQDLINRYIASCTCWFCGRVAVGDGINFVKMGCDVIPNIEEEDVGNTVDKDKSVIFVCRSCYTAMSRRADDISRGYYNRTQQEMREMEARLNAKIAAVEAHASAAVYMSRH